MTRVANIALAVLAVVVFGAAVYVVTHNEAPTSNGHGAGAVAVEHSTLPAPSSTPAPPSSTPAPSSLGIAATSTSGAPRHIVVAFLGDDWTAGAGASSKAQRFTTLLAAQLQVTERNFGAAGSGYAKQSAGGVTYESQVAAVVAAAPAVVVVSGGRNDASDDPATAAAHARGLFGQLRAQLPNAVLIAIAPFWGDSDLPPELAALGRAVRRGVTAAGGSYLDVPDPIHGHPSFMADDADPDDAGYAAIAAALEPQLAALLPH